MRLERVDVAAAIVDDRAVLIPLASTPGGLAPA
jgi:hypothetical protein